VQQQIYEAIKKNSRFEMNENVWNQLKTKIHYKEMDFTDRNTYCDLNDYLETIEKEYHTLGKRIYYLAVAPEYFETIVDNIKNDCMTQNMKDRPKVVIEKPFGRDLKSAEYLNQKMVDAFLEENIYRIDHYLGKEMLQNIMVIRFANTLFEPLWNNTYIEQIQITSSETLGVGSRGGYYEKSGAIRDMVQSHMLQLISLIAMEKPVDLNSKTIRDEKVKVLKALKQYDEHDQRAIRGQYGGSGEVLGYNEEDKVSKDSNTETYVALKLEIQNNRWNGVPFYIRTGKRMPKKTTEIVIEFKQSNTLYQKENLSPNMLVIKIQPMEGVFFQFNAKKPGTEPKIIPVQMDFCQNCQIGFNSPEAYERLLFDVMRGDATLFARWDEVEYSWKYVDAIISAWEKNKSIFPNYESGTWGPKEADELLRKDLKSWIVV